MHSWGCATRDGVCANASFSQVKNKKQVTNNLCCSRETQLAAWGWQFLIPKSWRVYRSPSGDGKETRRRVWRVVGIGVGLLRHDGEVEGVVVKDDAVLELCVRGRACYAQAHIPKRRSHHCVPSVL